MTKTIIPSDQRQEKRMANPGKNNVFVSSRAGGPAEQSRTKQASIKHENPEFFKRQSDRKMTDGGPGSGPQPGGGGGALTGNKPKGSLSANIAAARAKLSPQQRGAGTRKSNERANERSAEATKHANEHKGGEYSSKDIRNKGTTMTAKKDNIPARKDVPIQRDFNHKQPNIGKDPGRGPGQVGRDSAPSAMKQFAKGTMY